MDTQYYGCQSGLLVQIEPSATPAVEEISADLKVSLAQLRL